MKTFFEAFRQTIPVLSLNGQPLITFPSKQFWAAHTLFHCFLLSSNAAASFTHIPNKGVCGEKALSGVWLTTRFSFQVALYLLVKQKENLTQHKVSLRALLRAPLQMILKGKQQCSFREMLSSTAFSLLSAAHVVCSKPVTLRLQADQDRLRHFLINSNQVMDTTLLLVLQKQLL